MGLIKGPAPYQESPKSMKILGSSPSLTSANQIRQTMLSNHPFQCPINREMKGNRLKGAERLVAG